MCGDDGTAGTDSLAQAWEWRTEYDAVSTRAG